MGIKEAIELIKKIGSDAYKQNAIFNGFISKVKN